MRSTSPGTLNLVALAPHHGVRERLLSALSGRRVEILDEMLTDSSGRVSIVAVTAPSGPAEVFVSNNQAVSGAPPLEEVGDAVSNLLRLGRFQEGVALVLGRRRVHCERPASDYHDLLNSLAHPNAPAAASRCEQGIAGVGRDAASLTSTLLWWELARSTDKAPTLGTLHALKRAQQGFSALRAPWQAGLASSARRRTERTLQISLFDDAHNLRIEPLRFEVMPSLLARCEATATGAWAAASGTRDLSWRHLGSISVDHGNCEPDYGTTPLALRSLRATRLADTTVRIEFAVDFSVRIALGIDRPSRMERIRCSMADDGTGSLPRTLTAWAGETVTIHCDVDALVRQPMLTCTSSLGHFADFDLLAAGALEGDGRSRDCHATKAEAAAA
jgi:hypothetical protein